MKNEAKDVIVVGAGASGIAAALTLAEKGAAVAVFEKMAAPGGSAEGAAAMAATGAGRVCGGASE